MNNDDWFRVNDDGSLTILNREIDLRQTFELHDYGPEVTAELNRELDEMDSLERDGFQPLTAANVPDDTFGPYDYEVPKRKRLILPWPVNVTRSRLEDFCINPGFVIYGGEQVPLPPHEPPPPDISKPFSLAGFRVELIPNREHTEVVLTNALGLGSVYSVCLLEWLGENTVKQEQSDTAEKQGVGPLMAVSVNTTNGPHVPGQVYHRPPYIAGLLKAADVINVEVGKWAGDNGLVGTADANTAENGRTESGEQLGPTDNEQNESLSRLERGIIDAVTNRRANTMPLTDEDIAKDLADKKIYNPQTGKPYTREWVNRKRRELIRRDYDVDW